MKYRLLSWEELQELETEFIEFLSANGIDGQHWKKIKEKTPEKIDRFVELFSDVIFETSMRKISYLELRSKHHLVCFHCLEKELVAVGMKDPLMRPEVDFTNSDFLAKSSSAAPAGLEIYTSTKPYESQREQELFALMQKGAVITDNKLFNSLCLAL
jgi:hypothetical protein